MYVCLLSCLIHSRQSFCLTFSMTLHSVGPLRLGSPSHQVCVGRGWSSQEVRPWSSRGPGLFIEINAVIHVLESIILMYIFSVIFENVHY